MIRPFLVKLSATQISVYAADLEAATKFARNYAGDHRDDIRNRHTVEFSHTDFNDAHIYTFSITEVK
jgi:hypothetical protein